MLQLKPAPRLHPERRPLDTHRALLTCECRHAAVRPRADMRQRRDRLCLGVCCATGPINAAMQQPTCLLNSPASFKPAGGAGQVRVPLRLRHADGVAGDGALAGLAGPLRVWGAGPQGRGADGEQPTAPSLLPPAASLQPVSAGCMPTAGQCPSLLMLLSLSLMLRGRGLGLVTGS